jgi:ferredoxin/flavodoxin---NADP+ reductase
VSFDKNYAVAVIGAGPAGLYAAQYLARQGMQVVIFNRDIKPGGLAEYGIFPDKTKMRSGLLAQFKRILTMPLVRYQGNVVVGQSGDFHLDQLRAAGFRAFMVTTGAQRKNWLGLPGEDLAGVYHAHDIVFHFNRFPELAEQELHLGRQVAVIGVGNVMLDIVNYLQYEQHACRVTAYARRGPTEVKFDKPTLEPVAGCLDLEAIQVAVGEVKNEVAGVGATSDPFFALLTDARKKTPHCEAEVVFSMRFLRSPKRLIGDEAGRVQAVEFEINQLVLEDGQIRARGTGKSDTVAADTVIFSIGSQVDPGFGLPVAQGNYLTSPEPRFPVDGISYEVYNPDLCAHCEDIFVSGWARQAGEGIVGLARKDAERGAKALLSYLHTIDPLSPGSIDDVLNKLPKLEKKVVNVADLEILWETEGRIAAQRGLPEFKFETNQAMLDAIEKESKA